MNSITTMFKDTLLKVLQDNIESAGTEEEQKKILDKFDKLNIEELFKDFLNDISGETFLNIKNAMYEDVMYFRTSEQEFLARQEQKWCSAFVASEAMYIMTLNAAEDYSEYVSNLDKNEVEEKIWTHTVLCHIHGRTLQEFLEIITLMKNGFADCAYARWRSMYELTIIASFILEQGEKVAKAFYESADSEDRYDWAKTSEVFKNYKKHITFNDIQIKCDLNSEVWQQQYNLANKVVHASAQGTFKRLGNMGVQDVIPVGRSDYGITTAAEHSAISLSQMSAMYFSVFPDADILIRMKNISDWVNVVREEYFKTHDEVFPNDEPLWDESILTDVEK